MSAYGEPMEVAQLIGLAPVFTPAQAAEVLRSIGLDEITECALRTRAYRKQIPFHLNGHRIIFTTDDLREIAEGKPCRPSADETESPHPEPPVPPVPEQATRRRARTAGGQQDLWRARGPRHG
jgi:hypothetical protein